MNRASSLAPWGAMVVAVVALLQTCHTSADTKDLTVHERLAALEAKVDLLIEQVGRISDAVVPKRK